MVWRKQRYKCSDSTVNKVRIYSLRYVAVILPFLGQFMFCFCCRKRRDAQIFISTYCVSDGWIDFSRCFSGIFSCTYFIVGQSEDKTAVRDPTRILRWWDISTGDPQRLGRCWPVFCKMQFNVEICLKMKIAHFQGILPDAICIIQKPKLVASFETAFCLHQHRLWSARWNFKMLFMKNMELIDLQMDEYTRWIDCRQVCVGR